MAPQISRTLGLYLALAGLTLGLAFARFALGPWYHTYRPPEVSLLEGWPASWEVVYYTDQFPNFLGNAPARFGLAPVHYRTFTTLYLTTLLYSWTGSAYWSFAVVDLLFWWLAGIAAHRLAIRLGAGSQAAAMSAVLVITSPLLVSHMWRQDLHPANFASMSLGSWAAATLIDEARCWWRLTLSLAFLLLLLSLSYQYQWSMVPILLVLVLLGRRRHVIAGLGAVSGAVILYTGATAVLGHLLFIAVGPPTEWNYVAAQPGQMLMERLAGVHGLSDLLALIPSRYYQVELIRSYHPLVLVAGIVGALLLGPRMALATITGLGVSLFSITFYSAPWAATNTYPFVYVGAGVLCTTAGRLAGKGVARCLRPLILSDQAGWLTATAEWVVMCMLGLLMAAVTNLDLIGNTDFLLTWWRYFGGRYLF